MRPEGKSYRAARHRSDRSLMRRSLLVAAAACAASPVVIRATPKSFIFGGTTNWRDGANWLPAGEPGAGDDAFLLNGDPVDRVITYNTFLPTAPTLASVHVDALGIGLVTLSQNAQVLRANTQYIGDSGTGLFTQSGGTNQAGTLYLGFDSTATGIYSMTATARVQIASAMYVGYGGTGNFSQAGGAVTVDPGGELVVAYFAGSTGAYTITAGTLSTPTIRVGDDLGAIGQFDQSGGNVTVTGDLSLAAFDPTSTGTYAMTGGTLAVGSGAAGGSLVVGERGTGTFLHSAGNVFVNSGGTSSGTNGLVLGLEGGTGPLLPPSAGDYTLTGSGLLSVTGRAYIGFSGDATFTQTGGTHSVNGEIVIAANGGTAGASGTYLLDGGILSAGKITLNPSGTFTRTGGTMGVGTFTQDGGAINGTLTNAGTFVYNNGIFNARLVNQATSSVVLNADFIAADGIDNFTNFTIDAARAVTVNGFGLSNNVAGHIDMAGGLLTGAGPIANRGLLSGFGTITGTGGITNDGDWIIDPGDYVVANTGPIVNNMNLVVSGSLTGVALVLDAPTTQLQNNGTMVLNPNALVSGPGSLLNTPTGLINAADATITAPFTNQGTINIGSAGAGNLHVAGNFTNSGTINLTAPLTSLTGGAITNSGTISGQGQVASAISNAGTIRNNSPASVLDLSGALINQSTGLITVGSGATISANIVSNAGTVSINDGTFSSTAFINTGTVSLAGGVLDSDAITNTGTITYAPPAVPADVHSFGTITNNAGGKIRLTGTSTVNFYDTIANNPGAAIEVPAGATANFLANVTGGGAVTNAGTITFVTGTANALGEITGGGALSVSDAATLSTPRFTQGALNLISTGATGAVLNVNPALSSGSTSKVTSLNITGDSVPQARLDLANTNLVIDYAGGGGPSPLLTTRAQLRAGYNNGAWNGTTGITSSSAAAAPQTALGYGDASTALGLSGTTTANWNGQTVDASSVLIGYTLAGDANLDRAVNFTDLVALAQNYNVLDGSRVWSQGDFSYDGNVDFTDLVKLAQNYNQSLPAAPIPGASAAFNEDLAKAFAQVPEPSTTALLAFTAISFAGSRRRRNSPPRPRPD
jgi:hypothetical protein